jgi:hypothetical protein
VSFVLYYNTYKKALLDVRVISIYVFPEGKIMGGNNAFTRKQSVADFTRLSLMLE